MAVGAGMLIGWTYYYLTLVRPTGWWDASPLPVATAFVAGGLIEFAVWLFNYLAATEGPETIERFIWLDRLQKPAYTIGMAIHRHLYRSLGHATSVWFGSVCAFALLITMWSAAAFSMLTIIRVVTAQENSKDSVGAGMHGLGLLELFEQARR